jgi:hypothetical protein
MFYNPFISTKLVSQRQLTISTGAGSPNRFSAGSATCVKQRPIPLENSRLRTLKLAFNSNLLQVGAGFWSWSHWIDIVYRIKCRVVGMVKPEPMLAGDSLIHGLIPWLPRHSLLDTGQKSNIISLRVLLRSVRQWVYSPIKPRHWPTKYHWSCVISPINSNLYILTLSSLIITIQGLF